MSMRFRIAGLLLLTQTWMPQAVIGQDASTKPADILTTILLPTVSEILREGGIPPEDVEAAVIGARERGVPADETYEIFQETARSIDEHGPIDNFGAFVQAQLDGGLRGRDLAAAIRAEHARRGIGKGNRLEPRGRRPSQGRAPAGARQEAPDGADVSDSARRGRPPEPGMGRRSPDSALSPTGRRPPGGNGGDR